MLLTSPDEARRCIAATFLDALGQPAVVAALGGCAPRLRLGLVDPDCVFVIDGAARRIIDGPALDMASAGFVAMTGDTAISWCRGELDLDLALRSGDVAAEGECAYVMDVLAAKARLGEVLGLRLVQRTSLEPGGSVLRAG